VEFNAQPDTMQVISEAETAAIVVDVVGARSHLFVRLYIGSFVLSSLRWSLTIIGCILN